MGLRGRLVAALAAALLAWPAAATASPADGFEIVVLDAGHGGEDDGALGLLELVEKDLVLDVTLALEKRLRARGLRVVTTRDRDVFVPLESRFAIANDARGDLFISIHANAAGKPDVRGIETFFLSLAATDEGAAEVAARENEAFGGAAADAIRRTDPVLAILGDLMANDHHQDSAVFARLVQAELARRSGNHSRGVKQAPFVVLTGVQMPALLVEIGFITNADDARLLRGSGGRDAVVDALVAAVVEFGRRYDARRGRAAAPASGS